MRLIDGKLLTAEQSVRLALLDSVDRQQLIEAIAAHLRRAAAARRGTEYNTPKEWYSARFRL